MRVFVTGATGFIGSVVVPELISAGHQVLGLARNDAAAAALTRAGAEVHRGELVDTASLVAGARASDGVIHAGFIHDFSKFAESVAIDRKAVEAMLGALEGTNKPFVLTSGMPGLAPGRVATEDDAAPTEGFGAGRGQTENVALAAANRGVRVSVMRLPPSVHGVGDHGFVPILIDIAARTGVAAFVGAGANRWPAVHRLDAARLYRLAIERAALGTRLHAIAEDGVPMKSIAGAIGAGLGLPVKSIPADEAQKHFDWFAAFAAIDAGGSSAKTREMFDWKPAQPGLIADLQENYFKAGT